jgi:hypothetical protein
VCVAEHARALLRGGTTMTAFELALLVELRRIAAALELGRAPDVPVRRQHEVVAIDGIPEATYPFLPTDPDADTAPIDPKDVPCED